MYRFGLVILCALSLAACADRSIAPVVPQASKVGATQPVFVVSARQRNEDSGYFGGERTDDISYLDVDVSVPPNRRPGSLRMSYGMPNPQRHFAISSQTDLGSDQEFLRATRRAFADLPVIDREAVIYVHGYNNSYADGVFRAAQLTHDFEIPGISISFSWASAARPLGYPHDRDSALHARDGLEELLRKMPQSGARRVILVAHSMGSLLVMETLRQIEIANSGWSARNLEAVVLISPDIDVDVFKRQASKIKPLPKDFVVFVSEKDRVLNLSAQINGQSSRLGMLTDASELSEFPITLLDVSNFAAQGLGPNHFTIGSSSALIALMNQSQDLQRTMQRDPSARPGTLPNTFIRVQNATRVVLTRELLTSGQTLPLNIINER